MKEITKVEKQFKNVNNQKISIPTPQKGLEFSGGGGSLRPNILKRGMKINWNSRKIGEAQKVWILSGTTLGNDLI